MDSCTSTIVSSKTTNAVTKYTTVIVGYGFKKAKQVVIIIFIITYANFKLVIQNKRYL